MNPDQEWLHWKNLLFPRFFILPARSHCVSTLCYWKRLGLFLPNHSLLLLYCSGAPCFTSLFTSLINCWCNGNIFHKSLLDCADTLTHWKRTWLRTFWRLTLAPSLFLRLLLCSPVFLMKWEWRMRIAWRRDCSTGELWEIDLQTVRDWIIAEEQLEVTSSLQTALVNNQNVIRRRMWPLMA